MAERGDDLFQQRLLKLNRLKSKGIDPYPARFHRTHTVARALSYFQTIDSVGQTPRKHISIAGRLIRLRGMGKVTFADIQDSSGVIQLYISFKTLSEEQRFALGEIDTGDTIGVTGTMFRTRTGEATLRVTNFEILSKALRPLPEKWHGLQDVEKRHRQRYLDLIANEDAKKLFTIRSKFVSSMRRFLDSRGFAEVETPILLPIAAGAMAQPFVTEHQALDRVLYLRIATELYLKRLIVGGIEKVYEIGRVFRNEGIDTKHNPEFTTLESYEAYADYNDVMTMVEEMMAYISLEVLGTTVVEFAGNTLDFGKPWVRTSVRDAILERSGLDLAKPIYKDTEVLRRDVEGMGVVVYGLSPAQLYDKLLSHFVEPYIVNPTFLIDYPVEMSPLAKRKPNDNRLAERFEGFICGMEVANAFTELNDPIEQRLRFEEQEKFRLEYGDQEVDRLDEDFLVAVEHGMPPTGGLGMGIDRLVMIFTNQQSIREVILFPQLRSIDTTGSDT